MSSSEMDKRFEPASYEGRWQKVWAERGYFRARADSPRPSYCIMIPPPNVTGKLHMGHALQSTLQDLLTRWRRMKGDEALWLPGTDHAGIATQLMVERDLASQGKSRTELGRTAFLERMWEWKVKYQDNIRRQLEAIGSSCDFSRERFTLDPELSAAVREAFVRLYREKKIYRGEYIVNWSTGLDTAISDLEVEMRTVEDRLWRIAYPIEGSATGERIVVATTRPETMLGDTAIAFHPDDERYRHLTSARAVVPVAGRSIRFVADAAVDPEFGTGLVKLTPAHDPADFEMGRRHSLPSIQVIDRRGRMTAAAGAEFEGLTTDAARTKLLERLRSEGFLVADERYVHNVGFCQRSGTRVEPLVSTQWFCDVSEMASRGLEAWRRGELELIPEFWGKTWEHWLSTIRPWCISRQLWWGHQIPAWYDERGAVHVARSLEDAIELAGTDRLTQDPDVLDTWFSSGLWPFSTLGWPETTEDLRKFYPTSVLITGHDILFFWVARMVMMGVHFTGQLPFTRVHLTGLVRDAAGQKMSKTKGNVLDPEELIAEYGADAMRFTLAQLDAPGRDIPLDASRMAGYRAFGNKIWNATRFVLAKGPHGRVRTELDPAALELPERWILARLSETAATVNAELESFRFDLACHRLYQFFWSEFCDWYIEMSKPGLDAESARPQVADVLVTVLERALRLLHPVMPHLTEELWQRLPGREAIHPATICLAPFPETVESWRLSAQDEQQFERIRTFVTIVRNDRAELVSGEKGTTTEKRKAKAFVEGKDETARAAAVWLAGPKVFPLLRSLSGLSELTAVDSLPAGGRVHHELGLDFSIAFPESGSASTVEPVKVEKELAEVEALLERVRSRLANPGFADKAPPAVVEGARRQQAELEERRARLATALADAVTAGESAG